MKGQNAIVRQTVSDGTSLDVVEIFPTIQGEGPFAGQPAVFVRLQYCLLRCVYCDTSFDDGNGIEIRGLMDEVTRCRKSVSTDLIVLTGGEPLRQNIEPFVSLATRMGYRLQIETAGVSWPQGESGFRLLDLAEDGRNLFVVVSPKTGRLRDQMKIASAWKYIVRAGDEFDENDGLPLSSTQVQELKCKLARPLNKAPIYVQPCDESDSDVNNRNTEKAIGIAMKYGYRLSLQQHKMLGLR